MKKRLIVLCAALALSAAFALAKSSAPKSSSRASSSPHTERSSASSLYNYSKPSLKAPKPASQGFGGYTKPALQHASPAQAPTGYSKPVLRSSQDAQSAPAVRSQSVPSASLPTARAKGNRFDKDASQTLQRQQAQASLVAYKSRQAQFQSAPPPVATSNGRPVYVSNPVYSSTRVYGATPSFDEIHVRRRVIYDGWNPPVVIYHRSASYGAWDSVFLYWALSHDPLFGYHHRRDPDYIRWQLDAQSLADQDAELRAQLAAQSARIAELEQQKVAVNNAYLPAAVADDKFVALSDEAVQTLPVQKPVLRVATGIKGGKYYEIGQLLQAKGGSSFQVQLVPTSGAAENWKLLQSGAVDAAIVQSDTPFIERQLSPAAHTEDDPKMLLATVYCEYVMLVVGKDSAITSVKDLQQRGSTVYVGPEGSGTAVTWAGLAMQDSGYKQTRVRNLDYQSALENIGVDRQAAVMFVAGADAPLLKRAAATGQFKLIPVDDADLTEAVNDEGHPVYSSLLLTEDAYPGMQKGEVKTLSVDAVWTLSDAWVKKFGDPAFDQVNYAVIGVISDLHMANLKASTFHPGRILLWFGLGALAAFLFWRFISRVNVTR